MLHRSDVTQHKIPTVQRNWAIGTPQNRAKWEHKYLLARSFMESRHSIASILVEVAAQHPLIDGERPNEEFEKRLLLGKQLYEQETAMGKRVEIYVPGSRHVYQGIADKMSLSEAGIQFLRQQGVPGVIVHGEDLNVKYKASDGVYNSADECFVAASYFKDGGFGSLYSVLSPIQVFRKTLHYIEFGVVPLNFTAPTFDTYHDYIGELFEAIPVQTQFGGMSCGAQGDLVKPPSMPLSPYQQKYSQAFITPEKPR